MILWLGDEEELDTAGRWMGARQRWSAIRSAPKSEGLATLNNILIGYNLGKAKAYPLLYKLGHPRPKQITTNLPQVVCSPEQSSCVPGDRSI